VMKSIPIIFNNNNKLGGKYCDEPFSTISIDATGDIRMCGCQAWLPTVVGNIFNNTIQEILRSPLAKEIRDSIRDGSFKYCNTNICGIIANNQLRNVDEMQKNNPAEDLLTYFDESKLHIPTTYFIGGDATCNISCPSCRTHIIKNDQTTTENNIKIIELLNTQIFNEKSDRTIDIRLSTSGEVFASPLLMGFLKDFPIDRYPNAEFWLQTNGLLLKKRWDQLKHIEKNIKCITVTADSHIKNTYEVLRRGGAFENLVENLEYIQELKQRLNFRFSIRKVIQLGNYLEIENFYHWAKSMNADNVDYTRITDWGTYKNGEFSQIDVLNPDHSLYNDANTRIKNLRTYYNDVVLLGINCD
jgi:MoaA/NifB/PqqE/SkfB family radical SAM enzyme